MKQGNTLKISLGNFLRGLWDLMILNWLWVLCSIPLVTIGPATCALYAVTLKMARGEHVYPVRGFFQEFRGGFRQAFLLGLIAIALGIVAGVDAFFAMQQTGLLRTVYLVTATIVAAICLTFLCYAFPLQAMFRNPLKVQIKNAFALAFLSPGKTICLWLITLSPVAAALLLPQIAVQMLGFVYIIAGISGPVYWGSGILRDIFDKVNGGPVIPEMAEEEAS